ncbi:16S rRNA (guanine(527)-N(7))-methyltransferase RsmG [Octadecabacter sp.]|nr:16S rRNA (guanine(527)-N(7))-methyltransferase RsmG [Octadecabacter sp.]
MMSVTYEVGGINVSRETFERLRALASLIEKWTKSINLIAQTSSEGLWVRHIEDSAQIFAHAPNDWANWTDIGSGGGLPALVVSILDPSNRPLTLIESDQRKCLFLNTARRELDLKITVLNGRIENQDIPAADVMTARALAPLNDLLGFSEQLLKQDGVALFPKGARFQEELDLAHKNWTFDVKAHQSETHADARVLEISRIRRRER